MKDSWVDPNSVYFSKIKITPATETSKPSKSRLINGFFYRIEIKLRAVRKN